MRTMFHFGPLFCSFSLAPCKWALPLKLFRPRGVGFASGLCFPLHQLTIPQPREGGGNVPPNEGEGGVRVLRPRGRRNRLPQPRARRGHVVFAQKSRPPRGGGTGAESEPRPAAPWAGTTSNRGWDPPRVRVWSLHWPGLPGHKSVSGVSNT